MTGSAKQSRVARKIGLLRRCAPRNDGVRESAHCFNALIELAARDGNGMRSRVPDELLEDASLAELCRLLVSGIVRWIRNHEGVLRAALRHNDTRPGRWITFRGWRGPVSPMPRLICSTPWAEAIKAAKTRGIAFGFQVVLGTLVNANLNDPGPLSLHDPEIEVRLSNCLLLLLEAEIKPASSKTSIRNSAGRRK